MRSPTGPDTSEQGFPTSPEIVDNALLLASLSSLTTPQYLSSAITSAAAATRSRLVIVLFSRFFNRSPGEDATVDNQVDYLASHGISHTERWDDVQRLLTFIYVQASKTAHEMNKVLMDIDILLRGLDEVVLEDLADGIDVVFKPSGDSIAVPLPPKISEIRHVYLSVGDRPNDISRGSALGSESDGTKIPPLYPVVALGGTFDHLHPGHKILLSMGAWIAKRKLIVGVSDDKLLQKKANKEIIEKLPVRIERVRTFLEFFKPGLEYDIVPIDDVCGPAGWDPDIQALVVSKETLGGAKTVASERASRSLELLQLFVIDVISSTSSCLDHVDAEWLKKSKISSTFIREWIARQGKSISRSV
ncbi:hypothetical protein AX15_007747 [Amanita polypyramis BW_CC]|nr:hypothetical protein AX15_007747 [Amanita polypyramis BW_CC]